MNKGHSQISCTLTGWQPKHVHLTHRVASTKSASAPQSLSATAVERLSRISAFGDHSKANLASRADFSRQTPQRTVRGQSDGLTGRTVVSDGTGATDKSTFSDYPHYVNNDSTAIARSPLQSAAMCQILVSGVRTGTTGFRACYHRAGDPRTIHARTTRDAELAPSRMSFTSQPDLIPASYPSNGPARTNRGLSIQLIHSSIACRMVASDSASYWGPHPNDQPRLLLPTSRTPPS